MKRTFVCTMVLCLAMGICGVSGARAGTMDPNLEAVLEKAGEQDVFSVLVFMADRVDVNALYAQFKQDRVIRKERHEIVVRSLQERAAQAQSELLVHLDGLKSGNVIEHFESFWIANCIRVDATPDVIRRLAQREDVERVYPNYPIELIEPTRTPDTQSTDVEEVEPAGGHTLLPTPELGVQAVRAPEVWAMGITGAGVLVSTLDTGVDGNHPALASRWRGVADPRYAGHPGWAFFDPVTSWTFPQDSGYHGTHTMGSVCGGAPGNQVGVAPGAQWIHAAVIDRTSLYQTCTDAIAAFQWLIDPDGNPSTDWDVPQVCSNSWGIGTWHNVPPYNTPCDNSFWSYIDACEAAGIVVFFSAGNEGPTANSLRRPGDRATDEYRNCAVAGINANSPPNWFMYSSSSRGPTYCTPTGAAAIKPDIAAPAEGVVSCMPGGSYGSLSGTSMASPHVNGVVALMLEACPELYPDDVKQIIYDTALDLGPPGKDNDYGYGLIDAYEAVNLALAMCSGAPRARDVNAETPVNTPVTITLDARDFDGLPDPPGMLTYIINSLPDQGNTLTDPANGHLITAGDLPYALLNYGNQVIYTPYDDYYGTDSFEYKANDGGQPPDAGDSNIALVSILVLYDPPQITTSFLPPGLLNGYYGPVQLEAEDGQPELDWIVLTAGQYFETNLGASLFTQVGTARGWHADDSAWPYTLPFAFPFYGAEYTTAYVCSNGFINFGSSANSWSNSDSGLISATRIAVIWDDLRSDTGGSDIYIDESVPGQVTIRWAVTTYSGSYPCNFSATLYQDGMIRFHYGSGNTGLTPTIGISAGDGVNYRLSSYNNASSLTNANSLEYVRPAQLPDGVSLSSTGVLSGIPSEVGVFNPTFRVTDSLGRSDQRQLVLEINSGPVPPLAQGQNLQTPVNTELAINLFATDDGLPNPPGALTYIITSLPTHGWLVDPGAGFIGSVPYTLANGGNQVIYHPALWYVGADGLTFKANDGGVPPEGGDSMIASIAISVLPPASETIYFFDLNSNPGWMVEGQWAYGIPTGGGSHFRDPTSGYTGTAVYGYNLNGDYSNFMPIYNLTTTALDCRHLTNVELSFWKWLGVEAAPHDYAGVQVSNNGADWTTIWQNPTTTVSDNAWSRMTFNISGSADRQATVFIRWYMGPTDASVTYPGWNIDDVEIRGIFAPLCAGDLDGDGAIGLADLAQLLAHYGSTNPTYDQGDIDDDGDVDLADLSALLGVYGNNCP